MHCHNCQYPLWNLSSRTCPECGASFTLQDFLFLRDSARIHCQHCPHTYTAPAESGSLLRALPSPPWAPAKEGPPLPPLCPQCNGLHDLDTLVVTPADPDAIAVPAAGINPWIWRELPLIKRWYRTLALAFTRLEFVTDGTPARGANLASFIFALVTTTLAIGAAAVPFVVILGVKSLRAAAIFIAVVPLIAIGFTLLAAVWSFCAHAILSATGSLRGDRWLTFRSMCYGASGLVFAAIPCFGAIVAAIAWPIHAAAMVRRSQRVSWARALLALMPFMVLVVAITTYIDDEHVYHRWAATFAPLPPPPPPVIEQLADALRIYYADNNTYPDHPARLLWTGDAWPEHFAPDANRMVHVGNLTATEAFAADLDMLEHNLQIELSAGRANIGDTLFCTRGLEPHADRTDLWLLITTPELNGPRGTAPITIRLAGSTVVLAPDQFETAREAQNQLRQSLGLPPIPDPFAPLN